MSSPFSTLSLLPFHELTQDVLQTDPAFLPTLTFQNLTDRVRAVERPSQSRPRVLCQPKTSMELESGDVIHLSASIFVR